MKRIYSSSVFVVTDECDVLLILHKFHKKWLPIGGRHEPNETPLEAAIRELHEETGLLVRDADPAAGNHVVFPQIVGAPFGTPPGFIGYEEHDGKGGRYLNFCFIARTYKPIPIRNTGPDDEFDSYDWFEPIAYGTGWWGPVAMTYADNMPENVRDVLEYIYSVAVTSGSRFLDRQHFGV